MSIAKIGTDDIANVIIKVTNESSLLKGYLFAEKRIQNISLPTKVTQYDFTFVSELKDRWLLVRIEDYSSYQQLIIWLNTFKIKEAVNLDVQSYFKRELKVKNIKKKMIFKAHLKSDLEIRMTSVLSFIEKNSDVIFTDILDGKRWIEIPFDWGNYR